VGVPALGTRSWHAVLALVLALVLAGIAFNLTRAAASLPGPSLAKATTIAAKLITVPARAAPLARGPQLHLPTGWPWHDAWIQPYIRSCGPPRTPAPGPPAGNGITKDPRNTATARPADQPDPPTPQVTTPAGPPLAKVRV